MRIYVPYKYTEIAQLPPPKQRISLEQANRIKAIMARTAQELKKVTGENPGVVMADIKGFVFIKRYEVSEQILVDGS